MSGQTTWILGSDPDCDLVVDRPSVSRRHCRLSQRADGSFTVEDLGSTNGTFLNGQRVLAETPVRRQDEVTLGLTVPMPWPELPAADLSPLPRGADPGVRTLRVGREPDNDVVLDYPEVSGHHARVSISPGGREAVVEDLGSTNGTAVGSPTNQVTRAAIAPGDTVYFGHIAVAAVSFFEGIVAAADSVPELIFRGTVMTVGRSSGNDRVLDFPVVSSRHARLLRAGAELYIEDLGSSNGTFVNDRRITDPTRVAPGDLIGFGSYTLRLVDGSPAAVAGLVDIGPGNATAKSPDAAVAGSSALVPAPTVVTAVLAVQSVALAVLIYLAGRTSVSSGLFGLSLAAVWIGLTAALCERWLGAATGSGRGKIGPAAELAWSLLRSALVALAFSVALLALVPFFIAETGRWPAAGGVIALTVLVGSALGLVIVRLSGRFSVGLATAAGVILVLGLMGGPAQPLSGPGPVGRTATAALPTRWSFEALLLLSAGGRADDPESDPVEPFFPAEKARSGPLACTTALVAMLGGLVYADVLICSLSPAFRPRQAGPESR